MALWGKQDAAAPTGSGTVSVTNASTAVTGSGTTFLTDLDIGDVLIITSGTTTKNRVTAIASNTALTLADNFTGTTAASLAIANVKIQQQPKSSYQDSNAPKRKDALELVYGVDATEAVSGGDNVSAVSVAAGRTRYLEVPAVTFSGGGGSSAAATASISGGAVSAITVTNTGTGYTSVPTVTIAKPRRVIPTSGVTITTEQIAYATHGLVAADEVKYYHAGGTAITGLTNATSYFVSALGLAAGTFRLATTAVIAAGRTALAGVAISGTAGEFTCTATTLAVGDRIRITGTLGGTGTITSYATGTIYTVSAVTGSSPSVTGFTLTTDAGSAIVTTAGTPTGLTYTPFTIVLISGTGNNAQYFEIQATADQATATAAKGTGETGTSASHVGWVKRTVGTGARAGRIQYEVLCALSKNGITSDAADDIQFPD